MNNCLWGQIAKPNQDSTMRKLLIISSFSLLPFNIFSAEQVISSQEGQISENFRQIEMKEVLKEIQESCQDHNSILRSAFQILRTALQKSSIHRETASHSSDVKLSAKISLDGLDLSQLFSLKSSMIRSNDSQAKPRWCVN